LSRRARAKPPALGAHTESALPRTHAVLAEFVSGIFMDLEISTSLLDGSEWYPIHVVSDVLHDVVTYELAHGVERRRTAYNRRAVERLRRENKALLTEHAGFHDFFVPVGDVKSAWGALVTGPFAIRRPTANDVRVRWRWLTGRSARISDPEFARYLATTLATTTFEASMLQTFRRFLQGLASILAGRESIERLTAEVEPLRQKLREARRTERMWNAVRHMTDEGAWRTWQSPYRNQDLADMGATRFPEHALVGLAVPREKDADPIDVAIRRDAFQRACAELTQNKRGALAGRFGDHGVVFVTGEPNNAARARARLLELGQAAATLATRHRLRLHLGLGAADVPPPIPLRYQAALAAAERALARQSPVLVAERSTERSGTNALSELRGQLARAVSAEPNVLLPRFERYLEVTAAHCGYRFEPVRAHLEAGMERVTDALRTANALDGKILEELESALARAASESSTIDDLGAAYKKGIADIERALERPTHARQDRGMERANAYIREHFAERLSLAQVAKAAGFAPGYFSKLFAKTERLGFRDYVQRLRVERAKQMLLTTTLSAERVGQLCGFRARNHFHTIFKRSEKLTPSEYRQKARYADGRG
jgi:AraC-like DNA-binding protein